MTSPFGETVLHAVIVTFDILPEYWAEFRAAVLDNAGQSLSNEPGCRIFDVCEIVGGQRFVLYELYDDATAFEKHLESDHFRAFDTLSRPWVREKGVVRATRLGAKDGSAG